MSSANLERPGVFRDLEIGDVILVRLPQHRPPGFEQEGMRPGVIVGLPEHLGPVRFPVLLIAPFTTNRGGRWSRENQALYPRFPAGAGNLTAESLCLLDQVRAVDLSRVDQRWGRLSAVEYSPVREGLLKLLGTEPVD